MKGSKTLFCSSKFPWARERISSKFIDNLASSGLYACCRLANGISTWSHFLVTSRAVQHCYSIQYYTFSCYFIKWRWTNWKFYMTHTTLYDVSFPVFFVLYLTTMYSSRGYMSTNHLSTLLLFQCLLPRLFVELLNEAVQGVSYVCASSFCTVLCFTLCVYKFTP